MTIAVSRGHLERGTTGGCSCSHRVWARSVHAQRADQKARKGQRKSLGTSSARSSKTGMGWDEFKEAEIER